MSGFTDRWSGDTDDEAFVVIEYDSNRDGSDEYEVTVERDGGEDQRSIIVTGPVARAVLAGLAATIR